MIWILWRGMPYVIDEARIGSGSCLDRTGIAGRAAGFLDLGPEERRALVVEPLSDGDVLVRPAREPRPAEDVRSSTNAIVLFEGRKPQRTQS